MLVNNSGDKVENPSDPAAEYYPDNTYYDKYGVVCRYALEDTVYCPEDVTYGKAKYKLEPEGEAVNGFYKFLHFFFLLSEIRFTAREKT